MVSRQFDCKFIWGSRDFEEEIKRIREKIKREKGFTINISALTHQLANDLRNGEIIFEPNIQRFRKRNILKVGDTNIKIKKG